VHQHRLGPKDLGRAGDLMAAYIVRLKANGHDRWAALPYAYAHYRDGREIERGHRLYYQRQLRDKTQAGDPFALPHSFWQDPDPEIPQDAPYLVTRQMVATWMTRPDLMRHYGLESPGGRSGLAEWTAEWGAATAGPAIPNKAHAAFDAHAANLSLRKEMAALRKEIGALRASTSWRVTAPLRWLVASLRRS
jgi:hypothetical protein